MTLIITHRKNVIFFIFSLIITGCFFAESSFAESASSALSNVDSAKSNVDSANSLLNTTKETTKNISEFSSKNTDTNDDPNGKAITPTPQNETIKEKPGSIIDRIFGRITSIQTYVQRDSNENSAILTEIVIVYKDELISQISSKTTKEWFTINSESIKNLRASKDIQIYKFELTPDSTSKNYLIDLNSGAITAFLFNRLKNNSNSLPIKINPYKNLKLSFFSLGFNYSQVSE